MRALGMLTVFDASYDPPKRLSAFSGGDLLIRHPLFTGEPETHEETIQALKPGDLLYMNYPDFEKPLGKLVGFLNDPGSPRHLQPVYEALEDKTGFGAIKKGDLSIIHPTFALPVPYREAHGLDT